MQVDENSPSDSHSGLPEVGERCRACDAPCERFADGRVLGHVDVSYVRCGTCGLVMAVEPTWLEEAYGDAIAQLDVGLLDRCQILSSVTSTIRRSASGCAEVASWTGPEGTASSPG